MQPKTIKIIYWILTILFCVGALFGGVTEIMHTDSGIEVMKHLGYPIYVLCIIGTGKILGALALLQPKSRSLKEWAYAGFTIDLIGAAWSSAAVGDPFAMIMPAIIMLVILLVSYWLWKKI